MIRTFKAAQPGSSRGGHPSSGGHSSSHPYARGGGRGGYGNYRGKGLKRPHDNREPRSFAENYVKTRIAKSQGRDGEGQSRTNREVFEEGATENASTIQRARSGLALEQRERFVTGVLRPKAKFVYDQDIEDYRDYRHDEIVEDDAEVYIIEKGNYLSVKAKKEQLEREFADRTFSYEEDA
jgi:hypothetical protein